MHNTIFSLYYELEMFYSGPHVKTHFMSTTKGNGSVEMYEVLVKFFFEVWGCKAKHSGTMET